MRAAWPACRVAHRRSPLAKPRRCASSSSYAFAFDIDGVLLRGKGVLPGARDALRRLRDRDVPFVFVTNGGGCTEAAKAEELSNMFDLEVSRDIVLLSHSPMRELAPMYRDRRVLVLGNAAKEIAAEDVGLHNTVTAHEVASENPGIFHFVGDKWYVPRDLPTHKPSPLPPPPGAGGGGSGSGGFGCAGAGARLNLGGSSCGGDSPSRESVAAVMALHDPLDWLLELQVVVDVLAGGTPPGTGGGDGGIGGSGDGRCKGDSSSSGGSSGSHSSDGSSSDGDSNSVNSGGDTMDIRSGAIVGAQTPFYISNPDFIFASHYPAPRFAAGAFAECAKMLYERRFGRRCRIETFGKPTAATFAYATKMIEAERRRRGQGRPLRRIYMVGDNPSGDIRGANDAGPPWISNLVRTGVFQGAVGSNDLHHPARFVHDDAAACVRFALAREEGLLAPGEEAGGGGG